MKVICLTKNSAQYIMKTRTSNLNIWCRVLQGSILCPFLSLIHINDLWKASVSMNLIIFADNTDIFYFSKSIKILFEAMNSELHKIFDCLRYILKRRMSWDKLKPPGSHLAEIEPTGLSWNQLERPKKRRN